MFVKVILIFLNEKQIISEPVDFSRNELTTQLNTSTGTNGTSENTERAFSLYSSINSKSIKTQSSISILRSVSSDDMMLKSSDESTDDESDVDIIGDPKGYLT